MPTFVRTDETVLLAAVETAYGTDAAPTGASNAILTQNFSITPLDATTIQRNLDRPGYGADPVVLAGTLVSCSFAIELAGSGTAGDALPYGDILRGCGRSETLNAGVDAVYTPISKDFESLTLDAHLDGIHHKVVGWRGSVGINVATGALPTLNVNGMGLYVDPADAVLPTPDFTRFQDPLPVAEANTPIASLDGVELPTVNFSVSNGEQVNYRNLINQEAVTIDGRELTGQMEVLMSDLATFDPYTLARTHATLPVQLVHGVTAGNIIQFDAPRVQIASVGMGTNGGERTWQLGLRFVAGDAGNDELTITAR